MQSKKLNLDFSDATEILNLLRIRSAQLGKSQKALIIEALERYLAQEQEDEFIKSAADSGFAEWNNPDDAVYDSI